MTQFNVYKAIRWLDGNIIKEAPGEYYGQAEANDAYEATIYAAEALNAAGVNVEDWQLMAEREDKHHD